MSRYENLFEFQILPLQIKIPPRRNQNSFQMVIEMDYNFYW